MDATEKISGVVLIDKPRGMTSHDVVDRVRKITGIRRVGHAGTLDPTAEGLMLVCIGGATRIVQFLIDLPKQYSGTIRLGSISSTYDGEGSIKEQDQPLPRDSSMIEEAMNDQIGWRLQMAPPYSAVKVRGKKLYQYAREGLEVPQKHRKVRIYRFDLGEYSPPEIRFTTRVGSGAYVRAMAHDLGLQLQCGAYLSSLRRDSIGAFPLSDAAALAELVRSPTLLKERMIGIVEALAHLPRITVAPEIERAVLNGRGFTSDEILNCEVLPRPTEASLVLNTSGKVLSVVRGEVIARARGLRAAGAADPPSRGKAEPGHPLYFRPVRVLGRV